ncbi:MAG: PrsW family intramembrane metalloprotease [Longimicrobiales bacterium]
MTRKVAIALGLVLAVILLLTLGPAPFLIGLMTALAPVPFYVLLALWLDRHEPEPRHLLLQAFVWGMLAASTISLVMNAAVVAYLQLSIGLDDGLVHRLAQVLASPVFEELSKGAAIFFLFRRERHEFDNVMDGAVYAAMVGLGFAATENVLYYGQAGMARLAFVFALRGLASPFAHPLFTAMTGMGFGWAREATTVRQGVIRVLGGLTAAIGLHMLWNAAGAAHMFTWAYALIMVPTFAGVLLLLQGTISRERRLVRERMHLLPQLLDGSEIDELCGHAGVRGWLQRRFAGGAARDAAIAVHRVRRGAVELAFAARHADRDGAGAGRAQGGVGSHAAASADSRVAAFHANFEEALAGWRADRHAARTISARPEDH